MLGGEPGSSAGTHFHLPLGFEGIPPAVRCPDGIPQQDEGPAGDREAFVTSRSGCRHGEGGLQPRTVTAPPP